MQNRSTRYWVGIALILVGSYALAERLDLLYIDSGALAGAAFLLIGAALVSTYLRDNRMGKLILGTFFIFIGIAALNDTYRLFPGDLIGSLLLWLIAVLFLSIYLRDRGQWWAVIPAGVLFSLGIIASIDEVVYLRGDLSGVILFLGLALSFAYLYLIRSPKNRLEWAIWPALGSFLLAITIVVNEYLSFDISRYVFPLVLIGIGAVLIVKNLRRNGDPNRYVHDARG